MTQPLSTAAQAVLDSMEEILIKPPICLDEGPVSFVVISLMGAAALRAVVDQVVPLCSTRSDRGTQRMMIRASFLAIAAELEGQQ